jgi:outer membrane receptor protein involved in Fe transport
MRPHWYLDKTDTVTARHLASRVDDRDMVVAAKSCEETVMMLRSVLAAGMAAALISSLPAASQPARKTPQPEVDDVISVTCARRREEAVQDVPIPVSVVDGELMTEAGAFNVNRIRELIPAVQFYSSNPRSTGVNIRGLGALFGLTNDGIEPGVGYYVDGVLYARPAATTRRRARRRA